MSIEYADLMNTGEPNPATVLIVDDSENHRNMCRLFLETAGYRVQCAENGATGLEMARSVTPDLILLDVMMPVLDGHGMLEKLRADQRLAQIPVIILTMEYGGSEMLEAFDAGSNDYMRKPVDVDELLARVKMWIGLVSQRYRLESKLQRLREQNAFLKTEITRQFEAAEFPAGRSYPLEPDAPGILSSSAVHEFNNLFFRVTGHIELAMMENPERAGSENHLDNALSAAKQARKLLREIPTFTSRVPAGACAAAPANAASPENGAKSMVGSGEHILIVDDEEAIVNMQKQILECFNYTITSRTSSLEALEDFRTQPDKYQLVITDMVMPEKTGDQLAKDLLAIRPDIPIIMCTGWSEPVNEKQARGIGIRSYLKKPVTRQDFAQTVRNVLDGNENGSRTMMSL